MASGTTHVTATGNTTPTRPGQPQPPPAGVTGTIPPVQPTPPTPPAPGTITSPPAPQAAPAAPRGGLGTTTVAANYIASVSGDVAIVRRPDGSWSRGWIKVAAEPTAKGARLTVQSGHMEKDEPVTLVLQARVRHTRPDPQDPTKRITEEKVINLELLQTGKINTNGFDHTSTFDLDYDALNAYLQQHAPQLHLEPGTPLAVFAAWEAGHQWGGYARNGILYIPQRLQNPLPTSAATAGFRDPLGGPIPLDIGVELPDALVDAYTEYNNGQPLKPLRRGGQFMSRVESEVKVTVPWDQGSAVAKRVLDLIQNPAQAAQIFGPDWSVSLDDVKRFYKFDPQGRMLLDAEGLPQVFPMLDRYYDSATGTLAEKGIALRFRETPKDPHGLVNIKLPSPAALPNPTNLAGLIGRYDTGIETIKGIRSNPQALQQFFDSTEHLNAFRYVREMIPGIDAKSVLRPAMDLTTKRYKLTLQHKNGTSIELSLDHVTAIALDDKGQVRLNNGKPMVASFWQLELDLEHLQTQSTNINAGSGSAVVAGLGQFTRETDQVAWLKNLGPDAVLSGPPRIHQPSDVMNPSIVGSDSYKLLLDVGPKLHRWLLPQGATSALQKYAMAARLVGVVPMSTAERQRFARELAVADAFDDAYAATYKAPEEEAQRLLDTARTEADRLVAQREKMLSAMRSLRWHMSVLYRAALQCQEAARSAPSERQVAATNYTIAMGENLRLFDSARTALGEYRDALAALGFTPSATLLAADDAITRARADVVLATDLTMAEVAAVVAEGEKAIQTAPAGQRAHAVAAAATAHKDAVAKAKTQLDPIVKTTDELLAGFPLKLGDSTEPASHYNAAEGRATRLRSDAAWAALGRL